MKTIEKPNIGFKHRIGNFISGFFRIFDVLIMILSFRYFASRATKIFYVEKDK